MRDLPIGIDNFSDIVKFNLFYVDKTKLLYELVSEPVLYILSRPRRFGKTLLLSTIEHILLGHRDLFKGLWIYDSDYDWTPHPVITLDMNCIASSSPETIEADLMDYIDDISLKEKINLPKSSLQLRFAILIRRIFKKYNNDVAILIDEYDAQVIQNLDSPPLAEKNRRVLAEFYGALKTVQNERGLVFITGVSRIALASQFSGLNNLRDLTFDSDYADICGLNASELEILLGERHGRSIEALAAERRRVPGGDIDDLRRQVMDWYGGYSWDGRTRVLNPFSTLSFFEENAINIYWQPAGPPSFLKKWLSANKIEINASIDLIIYESDNIIDEMDKIKPAVLLFQAGYLTVKEDVTAPGELVSYRLGLPNREIKESLGALRSYTEPPNNSMLAKRSCEQAFDSLFRLDARGFEKGFSEYLRHYPKEDLPPYEGHYRMLLIFAANMANHLCQWEGHTSEGRYDAHLESPSGDHFIFELRYVGFGRREGEPNFSDGSDEAESPKGAAEMSPEKAPEMSPEEDAEKRRERVKSEATRKRRMAKAARSALIQIREKYARAFSGGPHRVYQVALVVGGRYDILAEIEEYAR